MKIVRGAENLVKNERAAPTPTTQEEQAPASE
jgi:hypothetical protein